MVQKGGERGTKAHGFGVTEVPIYRVRRCVGLIYRPHVAYVCVYVRVYVRAPGDIYFYRRSCGACGDWMRPTGIFLDSGM